MILFVDDEQRLVGAYLDELKAAGFEVSPHMCVDSAVRFFDQNRNLVTLLVVDIMMPPGATFEFSGTMEGTRTGMCFYDYVRERAPDLAVIVLTSVTDPFIKKRFELEPNCLFVGKHECLPFELVARAKELLAHPRTRVENG